MPFVSTPESRARAERFASDAVGPWLYEGRVVSVVRTPQGGLAVEAEPALGLGRVVLDGRKIDPSPGSFFELGGVSSDQLGNFLT